MDLQYVIQYGTYADFTDLVGKTLVSAVNEGGEQLIFTADTGEVYVQYHAHDCCESVAIEDITGDLEDLTGSPILFAEERSNREDPPLDEGEDSYTWTFYRIGTIRGTVVIRWYGSSNGFYSESVDFVRMRC